MILNALVKQVKRRSKDDIKDETAETHWMRDGTTSLLSGVSVDLRANIRK